MNSNNQRIDRFRRSRNDQSKVFIEGFHALKHAMRFNAEFEEIVTDDYDAVIELSRQLAPDITNQLADSLIAVKTTTFEQLSPRLPRTRVLALAKRPTRAIPKNGRLVLLDDPRDLGNVGTIIRTCAAAGVDGLLVRGSIDPWHPTVTLSAAGLNFALNVHTVGVDQLPDIPMVVFDENGQDFAEFNATANQLLVFGSERIGVSSELKQRATHTYRIPMKPGVSSLNLATSVAIAVYALPNRSFDL